MSPPGTVRTGRRRQALLEPAGSGLGSGRRRRGPDERPRGAGGLPTLFDGQGGEATLDDVLAGAWEGLVARSVVACPVCAADMSPKFGASSVPIGGRCGGCGTTLC